MLLDQLRLRFGAVNAEAADRIERADAAQLTTWLRRVLAASSLAEVLQTPKAGDDA